MRKFSEKVDKTFSTKNWEDIIIERGSDKLEDALKRSSIDILIKKENKRRQLK